MTDSRANTSRNASQRSTRSSEERKKTWTPPDILGAPEPREGFKHRWVRKSLLGQDHTQNVIKRARQHYEPVKAENHPEYESQVVEDGKHEGVIMNGDLILMEVPEEVAQQRTAYYDAQADGLQRSVDHELQKEDREYMPITKDRKSDISYGNPNKGVNFQEDESQED